MKKLFCILACLALFAACDSSTGEQKEEPNIIFGVMSDTHIGASALASQTPETRLQKAYQKFAEIKPALNAIITVGDFTNGGTLAQFNTYKEIMDEYSPVEYNLLALGNHDNYQVNGDEAAARFSSVFGYDATKDTVINGYHFITVSTRDRVYNTNSYQHHRVWLEERLAAANAEDPHKPVFVFIHHTMKDTGLIGAKQAEAGPDGDLYDVFSKYSQVVTFSGHSHVSFADPRNIWQGDYTALNCGSVLYTALDFTHHLTAGKTDNAIDAEEAQVPNNRGESSTALIVEVKGTVVTVRRIDMYWNEEISTTFVFDTSANKSDFPYREEKRIAAATPPQFPAGAVITLNVAGNGIRYSFPQAATANPNIPDDGAFIYKVSFKPAGGTVVDTLLQAEYFIIPRPTTISHEAKNLMPDTSYEISITPVSYFGKTGTALTGTFTTGEESGPEVYPIPVIALTGGNPLPPGTTMNAFIVMLSGGYDLSQVTGMFGGPIFFKDNELKEPFTGADTIDTSMTIYSTVSLETLMSLIGG
jgi:3',5'-cyclic AMP phosphodiesterase CpdA